MFYAVLTGLNISVILPRPYGLGFSAFQAFRSAESAI